MRLRLLLDEKMRLNQWLIQLRLTRYYLLLGAFENLEVICASCNSLQKIRTRGTAFYLENLESVAASVAAAVANGVVSSDMSEAHRAITQMLGGLQSAGQNFG
jgi:hypothetical protein